MGLWIRALSPRTARRAARTLRASGASHALVMAWWKDPGKDPRIVNRRAGVVLRAAWEGPIVPWAYPDRDRTSWDPMFARLGEAARAWGSGAICLDVETPFRGRPRRAAALLRRARSWCDERGLALWFSSFSALGLQRAAGPICDVGIPQPYSDPSRIAPDLALWAARGPWKVLPAVPAWKATESFLEAFSGDSALPRSFSVWSEPQIDAEEAAALRRLSPAPGAEPPRRRSPS